ncbi:MAG: hypothetical protein GWP14_07780 [Actinobacteria bacterium]|nr:hypothetical protein [Actinomycetota bacterium]
MLRKLMAILLVFAMVGLFFGGCKNSDEPKTMDAYRKDTEKTINEQNAEAELQKIKKEIDADIGAE